MFTPPMPPVKQSHRLRNWLIGISLAFVALVGGLVGCAAILSSALSHAANPDAVSGQSSASSNSGTATSPASAPSSPTPSGPVALMLGDSASISQDGANAATIVISRRVVSSQPVDQYSSGPQNGYFVAVRVKVDAASSLTSGFDINPLDFYALSGTAHYDEGDGNAFDGPHNGSELNASTLNASETASGWLVFDLPSPHGKIVYAPNFDGSPLAYWSF